MVIYVILRECFECWHKVKYHHCCLVGARLLTKFGEKGKQKYLRDGIEQSLKSHGNLALILSFIALIGGFFITSLIGYVFGIISIILSLLRFKTEKKKCLIAIIISTIAMLLPIVLALALAFSLSEF